MRAPREERIGRYELLIELGRGGMAELFLGRLHGAGGFAKIVALKRILPHLAQDKQFKEMFLNEGRIASNLSHPNVCQVFELDEADDELYLAMEYLDGVSWDHLCRELATGNFAMRLAVGVIGQACEGLHYAHSYRDLEGNTVQVVHRDVSPQNLFVTVAGVCKVLDFGVSKVMTDGPRTSSGVIKGKLPYMAPEQIRGESIDGRADIFALGVCMWEALTMQRLFDRPTDFMIWKAITEEDVPSVLVHWPECPPALDAVVRRALDRDPDKRFATAREFAEALRAASGLPPCTHAEIAESVKLRCGERILERQRQVATAVSSRRLDLLDSAQTQKRPVANSMEIRQQSVTLDLRTEGRRARDFVEEEAADTRDLRRDAAETRTVAPPSQTDDDIPVPSRSNLKLTILVAMIAAAVTAGVVVTVMMMNRDPEREVAPPVAPQMPTINIITQEPTPDAAPAILEPPPPDAAIVVTPAKKTRRTTKPVTVTKPAATETTDADAPTTGFGDINKTAEEARKAGEEARKAGEDLQKSMEKLREQLQPK
ncbi:MAG: protein kinase [Myxococcota bacterium]|nr:protein kinase [Myxococcota bacterium]